MWKVKVFEDHNLATNGKHGQLMKWESVSHACISAGAEVQFVWTGLSMTSVPKIRLMMLIFACMPSSRRAQSTGVLASAMASAFSSVTDLSASTKSMISWVIVEVRIAFKNVAYTGTEAWRTEVVRWWHCTSAHHVEALM